MCVLYTLGEGERGLETVCLACMVNEIPIIHIVSDEVRIHLVRSAAVYAIHKEIGDRRGEGRGLRKKVKHLYRIIIYMDTITTNVNSKRSKGEPKTKGRWPFYNAF